MGFLLIRVARRLSYCLAYIGTTVSSSETKEKRLSTMVTGPGGVCASDRLNEETLTHLYTYTLYMYVSNSGQVPRSF